MKFVSQTFSPQLSLSSSCHLASLFNLIVLWQQSKLILPFPLPASFSVSFFPFPLSSLLPFFLPNLGLFIFSSYFQQMLLFDNKIKLDIITNLQILNKTNLIYNTLYSLLVARLIGGICLPKKWSSFTHTQFSYWVCLNVDFTFCCGFCLGSCINPAGLRHNSPSIRKELQLWSCLRVSRKVNIPSIHFAIKKYTSQ